MKKSSKTGHALCRKKRYNEPASGCGDTERENNMNETHITADLIARYAHELYEEEKSSATIENTSEMSVLFQNMPDHKRSRKI